jgi:hypothetical protein
VKVSGQWAGLAFWIYFAFLCWLPRFATMWSSHSLWRLDETFITSKKLSFQSMRYNGPMPHNGVSERDFRTGYQGHTNPEGASNCHHVIARLPLPGPQRAFLSVSHPTHSQRTRLSRLLANTFAQTSFIRIATSIQKRNRHHVS